MYVCVCVRVCMGVCAWVGVLGMWPIGVGCVLAVGVGMFCLLLGILF